MLGGRVVSIEGLCFHRFFDGHSRSCWWLFAGGVTSCAPDQFQCRDGSCIPSLLLCDGVHNCADRSDESSCMPGMRAERSL